MVQRLQQLVVLCAAGALLLLIWAAQKPEVEVPTPQPPTPRPSETSVPQPAPPSATPTSIWPQLEREAIPALSASGRLVFVCEGAALCLMDADGSQRAVVVPDSRRGTFSAPTWAPDGSAFAALYTYGQGRPTTEVREPYHEVVLLSREGQLLARFDGGSQTPLLKLSQLTLRWSPSGSRLALAAALVEETNRSAQGTVWILDRNYLALLRSFRLPKLFSEPGWSYDERWLLFETAAAQGSAGTSSSHQILLYSLESGDTKLIAIGSNPTWGPGADDLTYVSPAGDSLRVVNIDTEERRLLLNTARLALLLGIAPDVLLDGGLSFAGPEWSPDGGYLAARALLSSGLEGKSQRIVILLTIDAGITGAHHWPGPGLMDGARLRWSPDGRRLAYAYRVQHSPAAARSSDLRCYTGLIIADVARGSYSEVGCDLITGWGSPSDWSADGRHFALGLGSSLLILAADDPGVRWAFRAAMAGELDWGK